MSTGNKEHRIAYPASLIQAVGEYLVQRPHFEVDHLVAGLRDGGVRVEIETPGTVPQPSGGSAHEDA